jgi:hypothetical protein
VTIFGGLPAHYRRLYVHSNANMSSDTLRLAPAGFESVLNGKIAERVFRLNLDGLNAKFGNVCDRMVITVYQSVGGDCDKMGLEIVFI